MTAKTRWITAASGGGLLVLITFAVAVWLGAGREPTKADPANPRLVAHGKAVYSQYCASCHGAHLEGQANWRERQSNGRLPAPPHDASGHTWHHPDKQLFDMVKNGTAAMLPGYETDMPAYKDMLSDPDIWAVLSFIESTWLPNIRERQQRMNRQAE